MAKINLLPWREELKKQQQQDFITALVLAVLLTCLLFAGGYFYIEDRISYQNRRNNYLDAEIAKIEAKIKSINLIKDKKNKLRDKIEIIENLQASRSEIVHVFDELRKITPEGIYLTSFIQLEHKITLKGFLMANSEVPMLMDAIVKSEWLKLDGTGLKTIDGRERDEKEKYSQFVVLAKQVKRKDKKSDAENNIDVEDK